MWVWISWLRPRHVSPNEGLPLTHISHKLVGSERLAQRIFGIAWQEYAQPMGADDDASTYLVLTVSRRRTCVLVA